MDMENFIKIRIVTLSVIPWFHAYGIITMLGGMICGTKIVTLPRYEEESFLQAIEV